MHISANMGPKLYMVFRHIFSSEFVTSVTRERGLRPKVTKSDIRGRGSNIDFLCDMPFEWPLYKLPKSIRMTFTKSILTAVFHQENFSN